MRQTFEIQGVKLNLFKLSRRISMFVKTPGFVQFLKRNEALRSEAFRTAKNKSSRPDHLPTKDLKQRHKKGVSGGKKRFFYNSIYKVVKQN